MLHHKMTRRDLEHFFGTDDLSKGNCNLLYVNADSLRLVRSSLPVTLRALKLALLKCITKTSKDTSFKDLMPNGLRRHRNTEVKVLEPIGPLQLALIPVSVP